MQQTASMAVQPARAATLPSSAPPVIRRRVLWPFPVGGGGTRRKTDNMAATAQAVIATTTRAFLS